jgi:hypothetical protein
MRSCSTCGQPIEKASLFCAACGMKVPPESAPTEAQHSVRIDRVDPLASTSPASMSPARKLEGVPSNAVSPKAETGFQPSPAKAALEARSPGPELAPLPAPAVMAATSQRPSRPNVGTRGKTAPLSAMPNPPKIAGAPALSPQPQAPPVFAAAARVAQAVPVVPPGAVPVAPGPPPLAGPPPGAFAAGAFPPGMRVLVQWSNGQRYPGVVAQVNGAQCLVRFDAGEQRWVETRYVSPFG